MNQNVLSIWQNYRNEAAIPEEVPKIERENSRKCGRELPSSSNCNWLSWLAE